MSGIKKSIIISKEIWIAFMSMFLLVQGNNLNCQMDHSNCILSNDAIEIKVQHIKCVTEECKEAFLIDGDDQWYLCEMVNEKTGNCKKMFKKNTLQLQSTFLDLLIENPSSTNRVVDSATPSNELADKRALPFETLNYGRRKRQLPFETLNYGKRSHGCDCTKSNDQHYIQQRALPFETMLYGKRALPFETLNYGKRAYIPIDGYIMGKREQQQQQYD